MPCPEKRQIRDHDREELFHGQDQFSIYSGSGIPHDIKERNPKRLFFTTKTVKGTGLGLAICNEIITK